MNLVSGGTGLVGSHLLYSLVQKGKKVRSIYRTEQSKLKTKKVFNTYPYPELFDKIEWVKVDISDYFSLKDVFQNIELVYHAAAMVSFNQMDARKMMEVNVDGTTHMVNLSLEFGIKKFCFVSSVSALGEYEGNKCTNEDALWQYTNETSNYSVSKYYAENEVWRGSQEGLKVVIVNPATIIGYGDWNESSSTLVKKVYDGLSFYPSGSNGFVGVDDVIKVIHLLMDGNIENKRYLLVSENCSFKKLFTLIAEGLKKSPPQYAVKKTLATLFSRFDFIKSIVIGSKPVLTRENIRTAYREKCYSAEKIKTELHFEFEKIESTILKTTALYLSTLSDLK